MLKRIMLFTFLALMLMQLTFGGVHASVPDLSPSQKTPTSPFLNEVIAPQVFPQAEGLAPMCGNGCSKSEEGVECTDWAPAAGGSVCQAKTICSTNSQGEESCSPPWVAELDLDAPYPDSFSVRTNDDTPIVPGDQTFTVISEEDMAARIQPAQIRQIYTSPPATLTPYKHFYAADNHILWLMCEIDTRGADKNCDVYQPWP